MGDVELAKATRKRPDPVAIATKGRQTSYEADDMDIKTKASVRR